MDNQPLSAYHNKGILEGQKKNLKAIKNKKMYVILLYWIFDYLCFFDFSKIYIFSENLEIEKFLKLKLILFPQIFYLLIVIKLYFILLLRFDFI